MIVDYAEKSKIEAYLCATTLTTIDYLVQKIKPQAETRKIIFQLLKIFEIAPVNRSVLVRALEKNLRDYEDSVLLSSAELVGADIIITRNTKDFGRCSLRVLHPDEFISCYSI